MEYFIRYYFMLPLGKPRGGDGSRGCEVRQVRGHRAAEHGRGAHARPARARRRRAVRLRVHCQVSAVAVHWSDTRHLMYGEVRQVRGHRALLNIHPLFSGGGWDEKMKNVL